MEKVGINGIEDRHEWTKSMRFLLFPLDCLYYLSYFCGQTHTHKTWKIFAFIICLTFVVKPIHIKHGKFHKQGLHADE